MGEVCKFLADGSLCSSLAIVFLEKLKRFGRRRCLLGPARFHETVFLISGLWGLPVDSYYCWYGGRMENIILTSLYKKKKCDFLPFSPASCQIWMPAPVCSVIHWVSGLTDDSWQQPIRVNASCQTHPKILNTEVWENRITEICLWVSVHWFLAHFDHRSTKISKKAALN